MSSAASPEPESASSGKEGGEDWCKEDITTMYLISDVHEYMYIHAYMGMYHVYGHVCAHV